MSEKEDEERQHKYQIASLVKLAKPLRSLSDKTREKAIKRIQDDAYALSVRSDWTGLGDTLVPGEYSILLAGGGPAYRLTGDLAQGEPVTARLEHQNWFTPWTVVPMDEKETAAALAYAGVFYWGE